MCILIVVMLVPAGGSSAQGTDKPPVPRAEEGGLIQALNSIGGVNANMPVDLMTEDHIVDSSPVITSISAGSFHTCALTNVGGIMCWGENTAGQLGDGSDVDRYTPVDVTGLTSGVIDIAAGGYHTCALTIGGGVKCWGGNLYGQLGDGRTSYYRLTPVDVSGLTSGVKAIAAGGSHTCALISGGGVKCWGYNVVGQLGDGTTTTRYTPVDVSGLNSGVIALSAGMYHTCALTANGGVKCWGGNLFGQLGDGTTSNYRHTPVDVSGLTSGVIALAAGGWFTCALTNLGGVKCWGDNLYGQLGDGTTTDRSTPVGVSGLTGEVNALSGGGEHTCALTGDGATCWGRNYYGQLGDGTTSNRFTPVDVSNITSSLTTLSAGGEGHTCAVTEGGGVKCWGRNDYGQLGDGTTINRYTPVDVVWEDVAGVEARVFLPIVTRTRMVSPIFVGETQPDENGHVEVGLPDGNTAVFQLLSESGGVITDANVTTIADDWGVTLIVVDVDSEYLPTILSVPYDSLVNSIATKLMSNLEIEPHEVPVRRPPVTGVLVDDQTSVRIDHLMELPANMDSWEFIHTRLEKILEYYPWLTLVFAGFGKIAEEAVVEFGEHFLIEISLDIVGFWEDISNWLHTNPAQQHIFVVNREIGIAIDLGCDTDIATTGILFGQVVDEFTNVGIKNATVRLNSDPNYTITTLYNGWYQIEGISGGEHTLEVMKDGYNNGAWIRTNEDVLVEPKQMVLAPTLKLDSDDDLHEVVINGDFETGTEYPWRIYRPDLGFDLPLIVDERPRLPDSMYSLKLGNANFNESLTSRYAVMFIPQGTVSADFSFKLRSEVDSGDGAFVNDILTIDLCYYKYKEICKTIKEYSTEYLVVNNWYTEIVDLFAISDPDLQAFAPDKPFWLQFTSSPGTSGEVDTTWYVDDVSIMLGRGLPQNQPPYTPKSPTPIDGAADQGLDVDLSWVGGDPDGDDVFYDIYFEVNNPLPSILVSADQSDTNFDPGTLKAGTQYYWQIVAKDDNGAITNGPVWDFTTVPDNIDIGEMVFIPAGSFQMGCDSSNSDEECESDEQPLHTVYLDTYNIDKYEVTNAQYAQCVSAGACNPPYVKSSLSRASYYDHPDYADYPVIYVTWSDAKNYCAWAGKRLPTEAEWEKAARGSSDTRMYPWGNTPVDCTLANFERDSSSGGYCVGDTSQVGTYPAGASFYGVLDMAGNVREWVADLYDSDYYSSYPVDGWPNNPTGPTSGTTNVLRGGSFDTIWASIRTADRYFFYPNSVSWDEGFRCAKTP
jgi:formylglycine-generating enzyme required for sulfatase activity/alpha-tubulin suppressor-like RCC1 family protein